MSADAGSTGADNRIDDSAIAVEKALSDCSDLESDDVLWLGELAWQIMVAPICFVPNFGKEIGFERFEGIVSDIFEYRKIGIEEKGWFEGRSVERWCLEI